MGDVLYFCDWTQTVHTEVDAYGEVCCFLWLHYISHNPHFDGFIIHITW